MAKKRKLNWKIIWWGTIPALVIVLMVAVASRERFRHIFTSDYQTPLNRAHQQIDHKEFRRADSSFGLAYRIASYHKDNDAMIQILNAMAEFHKIHNIVDDKKKPIEPDSAAYHPADWTKAIGCWNKIVSIDPKNIEALRKVLDFYYEVSDSGSGNGWKLVETNADELIKACQDKKQPIDPQLTLRLGQARLMLAVIGETANRDMLCDSAIQSLQEAQKALPKDPKVYRLIAQALQLKGNLANLKGDTGARKSAVTEIDKVWQTAVGEITDQPDARIGILEWRLIKAAEDQKKAGEVNLQTDLDALIKDFPNNAQVQVFLARYYQMVQQQDKAIAAIETARKLDPTNYEYALQAATLYYRQFGLAADPKESMSWLDKSISIATDALNYPDTQDEPGPRQNIQAYRRQKIYEWLASWKIDKYRAEKDPQTLADAENAVQQIQQYLKTADNVYMGKWRGMLALAVGQVRQEEAAAIQDPKEKTVKLRKAAKQVSDAITSLYAAYQQLVGLKQDDPLLAYTLADAFRDRREIGARIEFLSQSFGTPDSIIASTKPDAPLTFAEALLGLGEGATAVKAVDLYEATFPPTTRSQSIRFQGLLLTGKYDEAEKWIQSLEPTNERLPAYKVQLLHRRIGSLYSEATQIKDSLNSVALQLELLKQTPKTPEGEIPQSVTDSIKKLEEDQKTILKNQKENQDKINALIPQRQAIVEKMMQKDPKTVDPEIVMEVCRQLAKNKSLDKAKSLAADYIKAMPQYVPMRVFVKALDFPPDTTLPQEQMTPIAIAAIREARPDQKVDQAVEIARYLLSLPATDPAMRAANRDKARAELQSVPDGADDSRVVEMLFDLSLPLDSKQPDAKPDLAATRTLAQKAKELDIDQCGGLFYQARIDMADKQYAQAVEKLTECIRIIPIFPYAYFFRAMAQQNLGNLAEAAKDIDRAYGWIPIDGEFARLRAVIYYQLYRKAGANPTPEEYTRMNQTMAGAVALNPDNRELLNFYADLITERESNRALGIRQTIMARFPSAENGYLLGNLALKLYDTFESNLVIQKYLENRGGKDLLLQIARKALEQAREMAPNDPSVMRAWGEYLRLSKQQNLAENTLPPDSLALVDFYLNDGKYGKAKAILQNMYEKDPKSNPGVLRGLIIVALKTGDSAGLERYARELTEMKIDDPKTKEATDLWILQRLLEARSDPEKTRQRAASFRERYPGNLEGLVMQAWADFNAGALADAQTRVGEILAQKPDHAVAWRIRGVLNRMNSDFKQAIADFQKSLSFVDDPFTRLELARTYRMTGQTTSAIGELISAIEKPQAPAAARYLLEQIYQDSGRTEDLQKFYEQTVAKYSDDPEWLFRAGSFFLNQYEKQTEQEKAQAQKQGKLTPGPIFKPSEKTQMMLDKAKPMLEKAWTLIEDKVKQDPQEAYASILDYYLESLLQGIENQTQLTQFIRIASKFVGTPLATTAYSQMAQGYLRLGDRTKGLEFFDKALESAKPQPEYIVQLLDVMRKVLESDKEVLAWCNKTLAADPKHIGATYTMFQLAQSNGEFNKAIEYIDRCLALLPEKNDTWVEYTLQKSRVLILAFFQTSDKKYLDGGVALYESILEASPKHPKIPMVLNNLAFLLADNNQDIDKAVGYARQALNETPNDPVRMDTLAYTLAKRGQFEEAEKMATTSIQQYELSGKLIPWDAYYHLGMAQEGLKNNANAKGSYEKALQTGGDAIPAPDKELIHQAVIRVSK